MESSALKKGKVSKPDRLSELLDELLIHILSFLPTIDAVRTVLLRRFGNLWTLVRTLSFDFLTYESLTNYKAWLANPYTNANAIDDDSKRFILFVFHVLTLHKTSNIDEFRLSLMSVRNCIASDAVTTWIRFAISKEVKEFDLSFMYARNLMPYVEMPRCVFSIFTSSFLVTLKLYGCKIKHLPRVHMKSLRKLVLASVFASGETMQELLSGCPCLRGVKVNDPLGIDKLSFDAPNIEKLNLSSERVLWLDCPNLKILNIDTFGIVRLGDVSSVREVSIQDWLSYHEDIENAMVNEFMWKFLNAEVFKLLNWNVQPLNLEKLKIPQNKWKHLVMRLGIHGQSLSGICRLLRSSPDLEELIIYMHEPSNSNLAQDNNGVNLELSAPCVMREMSAVILEKLVIVPENKLKYFCL